MNTPPLPSTDLSRNGRLAKQLIKSGFDVNLLRVDAHGTLDGGYTTWGTDKISLDCLAGYTMLCQMYKVEKTRARIAGVAPVTVITLGDRRLPSWRHPATPPAPILLQTHAVSPITVVD
jgi:hypothetical protein